MDSIITEQYLNRFYEDLQKEQMTLMNEMKLGCDAEKERDITKQISLINTLLINSLRLRNVRQKKIFD
jgi:hypothetical protein